MSTPEQIRRQVDDLAKKRADNDRHLAEARARQAKKDEEASNYRSRAAKASSESTARMYLRQAESAQKDAHAQGKKVADHSKRAAEYSKKEAELSRAMSTAMAKERADEERSRKRREAEDQRARKRLEDAERRARDRERQAERARTAALLSASESRLSQQISEIRAPKPERLRILYVTASPEGDLRVDKEIRRVKIGVQAATHRDLVTIETLPAATPSDLLEALGRFRPHVVHFSGHAGPDVLAFDTDSVGDNPGQVVSADAFARAMGAVDEPPILVVLNACDSETQLEGLLTVVPIAIGMSDSIGDADAMAFAARFYTAIADGQSVHSAWALARVQMEFDGLADADLPVLGSRPDVDPSLVTLVLPPVGA
jgi:hypothetical protein